MSNSTQARKWYENTVFYQLHVRAFHDANGDGHGDFRGAALKLNYIKSLGVDCVWIMPMYPSPLVDDGYDVADYRNIHPQFGTLDDFKHFLDEAHQRGLKVIVDFVVNHTSDQHEWFVDARSSRNSKYRDYYVWSDTGSEYAGMPVIFPDFETSNWTFDELTGQYYWHRFYARQPDLNYDNPKVREEMLNVVRYWLDMGVDGFRVDAAGHLFEREGTNGNGLPETHQFYCDMRAMMEKEYDDRLMMSEAAAPGERVLDYFGKSDEFQVCIHFHFAASIFASLAIRTREALLKVMEYANDNPDGTQWATYLRSHDGLNFGLLDDRDRERAMRTYGQDRRSLFAERELRRRFNALIENDPHQRTIAFSILFSWPGSPIIYYGDEIGLGENLSLPDRYPCRQPMQWNSGRNGGFSEATHTYLPVIREGEYGYLENNVEAQENDPGSCLNLVRRLTKLYHETEALKGSSIEYIDTANKFVLGYRRRTGDKELRCLFNFRNFPQAIDPAVVENTRDILGLYSFNGSSIIPPNAVYWLEPK